MNRLLVVGRSGSGKSTFAAAASERLQAAHIELDAIHHQPNWQPLDPVEFRAQADAASDAPRWVADGNYGVVQPLLLAKADTLVWLDLPTLLTTSRVIRRSIRRSVTGEELWNGNTEDWRNMFRLDPKQNVIMWSVLSARRISERYEALMADPAHAHLTMHRLRTTAEVDAFLSSL